MDVARIQVAEAGSPSRGGPAGSPITIIEFSDFQCPFCSRVNPSLDQAKATYGDKVRFVFRQFPLNIHPQAPKAAEAALCANEQGKFWEMHDALFANQQKLSVPDLKATASELVADAGKFDACLDGGSMAPIVARDMADGTAAGVSGTPAVHQRPFHQRCRAVRGARQGDQRRALPQGHRGPGSEVTPAESSSTTSSAPELFGPEWAERLERELGTNEPYRAAAAAWKGSWRSPSCPTARPAFRPAVALSDLAHGSCRAARPALPGDIENATFCLTGPAAVWLRLLSGALEPGVALMGGGLKLTRGSLFSLLPHLEQPRRSSSAPVSYRPAFARSEPMRALQTTSQRARRSRPAFCACSRRRRRFGIWNPSEIDFSQDRADWATLASTSATCSCA